MNPYRILGLNLTAGEEEINDAWARALKAARRGGKFTVEEINDARSILNDPKKRLEYDLHEMPRTMEVCSEPVKSLPGAPTLGWVEGSMAFRWDPGETVLRRLNCDIPAPEKAGKSEYPQSYIGLLSLKPVEDWLKQFSAACSDPWSEPEGK